MLPREKFNNTVKEGINVDFQHTWVNWVHLLVVGPLLVYISLNGRKTPSGVFGFLVLLALAVIGFHIYILVMKYQGKSSQIEGFGSACRAESLTCA
jgi:hypothetical protein